MGLVKQGLRKGIGCKLLSWDKLITMITEVEAIINTRPLTYVYGDFIMFYIITPVHFLTANLVTVIPFDIEDDCEDVDYQQRRNSAQELTEYWRKSQKLGIMLNAFNHPLCSKLRWYKGGFLLAIVIYFA